MSGPSNSRRNFLKPRTLGKMLTTFTGGEWPQGEITREEEGWLYRLSREAMATRFQVLFEVLDADLTSAAEKGLDIIDDLESQLTVYREGSEVSRINRKAFGQEVMVEKGLFELLQMSRTLWEETGGCFDIAVHQLLKAWGIFKPPWRQPSRDEVQEALLKSGMDAVLLDEGKQAVRFSREGVEVNFGAIGKGYALEKAAERLLAGGLEHFLFHGGNSSLLARGASTWENGWLTAVVDPMDWSREMVHLLLRNRALSTSALSRECLTKGETAHIIDPRSGYPVQTDLASASVVCRSATVAEGLSTAFLVMGLDMALEYCQKHPEVGAVFLRRPHQGRPLEIIHTGIPSSSLEVLV